MKRILAQARKELTQLFRDRLTVLLALLLPLILLYLYGRAISFSVKDMAVAMQDFDQSARSRAYIDAVATSLTFRLVKLEEGQGVEEALAAETIRAAIIIPPNFDRDIARGRNVEVQWLVDATDANTANRIRGNAAAITQNFVATDHASAPPVQAEMRLWFNPGRESDKHIGPGVIAVVLAIFPPLLAALAMSREGEQKTILQVYVSSISAGEFILGKTLAYFCIAMAEWVLVVAVAVPLFGLRFAGDPTPFLVGTVIFLFCNVALGVMFGAAIPNQATAIQAVATFCFLLSFLISGFMFPLSNIPAELRWVSGIVPARYFIEITRDAFVRGGGWAAVWQGHVALVLLGSLFLFRAWWGLRKMQVQS